MVHWLQAEAGQALGRNDPTILQQVLHCLAIRILNYFPVLYFLVVDTKAEKEASWIYLSPLLFPCLDDGCPVVQGSINIINYFV